jgi:hypothetical protein
MWYSNIYEKCIVLCILTINDKPKYNPLYLELQGWSPIKKIIIIIIDSTQICLIFVPPRVCFGWLFQSKWTCYTRTEDYISRKICQVAYKVRPPPTVDLIPTFHVCFCPRTEKQAQEKTDISPFFLSVWPHSGSKFEVCCPCIYPHKCTQANTWEERVWPLAVIGLC